MRLLLLFILVHSCLPKQSFPQLFGGQLKPNKIGRIETLNCAGSINNGILISGIVATNVNSIISYTGGNGGPYSGQTINSTGVIGLTASLAAGDFNMGVGNLTFLISGTPNSSGQAIFTLNIGGKNCDFTIQVFDAAVANPTSAACGSANVHNALKSYGVAIDQDGNAYKTVVIGSQEWMAENLRTSKFRNGDIIPNITDNSSWANSNSAAWCYNNNDINNNCPHGKLYNWFSINDSRNVCPANWHVPSDSEFQILMTYLNNSAAKMRSSGTYQSNTGYWSASSIIATNESGFSALPSGFRNSTTFLNSALGVDCELWSSSSSSTTSAWALSIFYNNGAIQRYSNPKTLGCSVRCIHD